jgi:hypothetical protein
MMKKIMLFATIATGLIFNACNHSDQSEVELLTGQLALEGICKNYVLTIESGSFNENLVEKSWKHPDSGVIYTHAFTMKNVCDLPASIKEGDLFKFTINKDEKSSDCVVCKAYSPTPMKGLYISIKE